MKKIFLLLFIFISSIVYAAPPSPWIPCSDGDGYCLDANKDGTVDFQINSTGQVVIGEWGTPSIPPTTKPYIKVAPYDTPVSSGNLVGMTTSGTRDFMSYGHAYRIRQNGSIVKFYIYVNSLTNTDAIYIKIWRKIGSTYSLVSISENIISQLSAGAYNTVTLDTAINALEGDYIGYRIETSGAATHQFFGRASITGAETFYVSNSTPSETGYDWEAQSSVNEVIVPMIMYMSYPNVIYIGDSIMAGHPGNYSFIEAGDTTDIDGAIPYLASLTNGYTYQNMGYGGDESDEVFTRYLPDCVNIHPDIIVLLVGINDILNGVNSKAVFIANISSMLSSAQYDSYIGKIIVIKILPCSAADTTESQARDDWNDSLATLVAGFSKASVVDCDTLVGEFRVGGDAGNYWDIQAAYDSGDGLHYNAAGYAVISNAIENAF